MKAPAGAPAWRLVLAPWVVSRLVALLALLVVVLTPGPLPKAGNAPDARGLWVWDAAWYRAIGESGYDGHVEGQNVLRFFPLLPLLGRALAPVLGSVDAALLAVSWGAAFAYAVLLVRLVRVELGDEGTARRVAWLAMVVPGAGVLVLAYTEPVSGALAVAFFLALRTNRPWLAVPLGILSGLARPTGLLLAAPAALEMLRHLRPVRARTLLAWSAAVLSSLLGTAFYCAWVGWRYGQPLLPYTVQASSELRGGIAVSPVAHLFRTAPYGLDWRLQLGLLALALVLLAGAARRLPLAYASWSLLVLLAALTSAHGRSLPRYVAGAFPLLMVLALYTGGRRERPAILVALGIFGYVAYLGFTGGYVL